jgi:small subunit ribosomal protein S18
MAMVRGKSSGPGGRGRGAAAQGADGKAGGQRRGLFRRRKVCKFCADKIDDINYKDVKLLSGFVPERGKVLPRRISGTCAKHQRGLRSAILRARQIALLPYATD